MRITINPHSPFRYAVVRKDTMQRVSRHHNMANAFKRAIMLERAGARVTIR